MQEMLFKNFPPLTRACGILLTPSAISYYPVGEGKKNGPFGSFTPPLKNP